MVRGTVKMRPNMLMESSCFKGGLCALTVAALAVVAPEALAQSDEPADPPAAAARAPAPAAVPEYTNVRNEWEPGDPVPPGYHADTEMFIPLVMAGGIQLGTSWLTLGVLPGAILLAAGGEVDCADCTAAGATMLVPAIGPFLTMAVLGGYGAGAAAGYALLAVDGLIQGAGLGMLIAGLVMEKDILVRDRVGGTDVELKPVVSAGPAGGTAGLSGSF